MEQNMRFGLSLGRLAKLKSNWDINYATLRMFFKVFMGKKKIFCVRTEKLHTICSIINFFWHKIGQIFINIYNQLCLTLLKSGDSSSSLHNFYIMTLLLSYSTKVYYYLVIFSHVIVTEYSLLLPIAHTVQCRMLITIFKVRKFKQYIP